MHESLTFWILFNAFVLLMLVLDLSVFHRKNEAMSFRQATGWSLFWIALAAAFALLIYHLEGRRHTVEFVTGYVIEESLSVDNLFVFLTLFSYFRVPDRYQYKVLFWGILGALVFRGLFILVGVSLVRRFEWIVIIFGLFLIYTAIKMLIQGDKRHGQPASNPLVGFARKHLRLTDDYVEDKFLVRRNGLIYATPLFLVLLVIEASDVLFAADSIPAVLSITRDAFIVYTSNVFAILGLRALYFALAGAMQMFRFLDEGVAFILLFVGGKMIAARWYDVPTGVSLSIIAAILILSIAASLVIKEKTSLKQSH